MATCPNDKAVLLGSGVVLEVAAGCADTVPLEASWSRLGQLTTKSVDWSPNTVTSDSDAGGGYVASYVTNADLTISCEGEMEKTDSAEFFGVGNLMAYLNAEIKARRQPTMWVRLIGSPQAITAYMVITAFSFDGGTNDIVTFSAEFKVADSDTVSIEETV